MAFDPIPSGRDPYLWGFAQQPAWFKVGLGLPKKPPTPLEIEHCYWWLEGGIMNQLQGDRRARCRAQGNRLMGRALYKHKQEELLKAGKPKRKPAKLTRAQLEKAHARLLAENRLLHEEMGDTDRLREQMSSILRRTADALHGGPLNNGYWSWHDLPELATKLRLEVETQSKFIAGLPEFFTVQTLTRAEAPAQDFHSAGTITFTDRIPYAAGWWWRVPYGWLLRAVQFMKTGE